MQWFCLYILPRLCHTREEIVSDLYSVFILSYFVASKVVVWKKFLLEYNNNNDQRDVYSRTVYRVITYLQRAQLYWFEELSTSLKGLGLKCVLCLASSLGSIRRLFGIFLQVSLDTPYRGISYPLKFLLSC